MPGCRWRLAGCVTPRRAICPSGLDSGRLRLCGGRQPAWPAVCRRGQGGGFQCDGVFVSRGGFLIWRGGDWPASSLHAGRGDLHIATAFAAPVAHHPALAQLAGVQPLVPGRAMGVAMNQNAAWRGVVELLGLGLASDSLKRVALQLPDDRFSSSEAGDYGTLFPRLRAMRDKFINS